MKNIAIIYWSLTGNTKSMAEAIKNGAESAGASAYLATSDEIDYAKVENADAVAFGCPAMSGEDLEETSFSPMFSRVLPFLKGKKVALFGSYGWTENLWMQNWEAQVKEAGVQLAYDSLITNGTPDREALSACMDLGRKLAD